MKNCFKQALAAVLVIACAVWALDNVSYIDANGVLRTVNGVTVISSDGGYRTLNSGWYLMRGTFPNGGTITVSGTVHIILENDSDVKVSYSDDAGINVSDDNSLSIYAQSTDAGIMGKLMINSYERYFSGAGIGGGYEGNGGTITINGGIVTATGSSGGGAGIGGGYGGNGGTITINGGIVTATGGGWGRDGGAGIGGGGGSPYIDDMTGAIHGDHGGNGGIITVTGGIVTATGGGSCYAAGIGGGGVSRGYGSDYAIYGGNGGIITISGGTVMAKSGGLVEPNDWCSFSEGGAGIGGGGGSSGSILTNGGSGGAITISGGIVTAESNVGAGIGGGGTGNGGTIIISGGTVTATSEGGVGIGGGYKSSGSKITINGGTVTATSLYGEAGIGIGIDGNGYEITISGGTVTATGGARYGAGIGGGGNGGTITISGGTVTATGGGEDSFGGAGIGGSSGNGGQGGGSGGTITISGGTVTATGGSKAQGIGIGINGNAAVGTFTLNGDAVVFANSVGDREASRRTGGILFESNFAGVFYGTSVTLGENVTIPASRTLAIPASATLTIPAGITLTNNGTVVKLGTINHGGNYGEWAGNPYLIPSSNIDLSESNPLPAGIGYTYANNIYTISDGAVVTVTGTSANQRRIAVAANATASITLRNVIISSNSPLLLNSGANVTLILEGENKLTAGSSSYAGIQAPTGTTLTISGTGSLVATGGSSGAGIGGGSSGSGGAITISGGVVTATGGSSAQGIGRGSSGTAGTFTLNGNAIVFANSVGDTEASRRTGGILFIGNAGTFYGTSVTLEGDVTIPASRTLTIPANAILTIPAGITLTNNGTVTPANGSTVIVAGTVMANKIIGANVNIPTLNGKTLTSITINALSLLATTGQIVEYAKNTTSTVPTSGWQTETTFGGLTENTTYYIFARSQANTNFATGTVTNVQIKTKSIPSATNLNFTIPTNHIYNGEARGIGNVTAKTTGIGTITVLYNGSVTVPTKAGTYSVKADIEEGDEFIAASGIVLGEYKITAKSVTITGLSASSKEYDGTETANIVGTAAVSGKVGSDVVNVTSGTASFANKNVGTNKTVTFSGFSLSGTDAGNYTLSAQPASTANITAKSVTITGITASNKEYDGNATATVTGTPTINGKIEDDVVTVKTGTASFDNSNVGTSKTVTFSGYSLSGTNANNYTLSAQPANSTANITTKSVTITASANNKEYDGKADATVKTTTINGKVGDDVVTVANGSATFSDKKAGNIKIVTFRDFSLSGTDANNYMLSAQPTNSIANITAKPVTITGITIDNKEYNGTYVAKIIGTPSISGKVGDDVVTVANGIASFDNKNVGARTVTFSNFSLSGTDAGNYTLSAQPASVTANITAKPVTITAMARNKEYDGNETATVGITIIINGKIDGDVATVANGSAMFSDKNVGTGKTITFSGFSLDGTDASNYTLSAQPANVTANITAKSVTIIGVTASNKEYDGNTTAIIAGNAAVSGIINDDVVTVANGTALFADKNVGNDKQVTFSGYSLSGADASNYKLSAQPARVTANITAKPVTITASVNNKVYNGDATATITGTPTINGKINNNVYVTNGTALFADKNVGNDKQVTFSGYSLTGTDASNYILSEQPASVTANITAKPVTIIGISASSKVYDGTTTATITGTATINGKVGDDVVTVDNGTASFNNKNVGTKTVTFSSFSLSGTDANNYTLSAQPASVTANITAKPLTITVTSITAKSKEYDGTKTAEVHGNVSISGEVSGDDVAIAKGNASFNDKNVGTDKSVTLTGFTLSGTSASNYTVSVYDPISITANITAKPVTITVSVSNKVYDGTTTATITGTPTINGKVSGDAVTVRNGTASFDNESVGTGKTVTFTGFTLEGTDAGNYTLSAQPASVTANITDQPAPTPPPIVEGDRCGNSAINYEKQFCWNDIVYPLCNGSEYDPETNKCQSGVLQYKCGASSWYSEEKQFCYNDKVYSLCNGSSYDPESEKCSGTGSSAVLQYKCGKNSWYNDEKQFCYNDKVYSLCGGSSYDPAYAKCQNGEVIYNTTPVLPQSALGNISVQVINNDIMLSNLLQGAKVEVYNLQGKLVFASVNRGSDILRIEVQTKGMYIVKAGSQTMRIAVR